MLLCDRLVVTDRTSCKIDLIRDVKDILQKALLACSLFLEVQQAMLLARFWPCVDAFSSALVFVLWEREGTRDENDYRHSYSCCTCPEIYFPEFDWPSDLSVTLHAVFQGLNAQLLSVSQEKSTLLSELITLQDSFIKEQSTTTVLILLTDAYVLQLNYRPFYRFIRECFDAWRPFWIVRNVFPIILNRLFPSYCARCVTKEFSCNFHEN